MRSVNEEYEKLILEKDSIPPKQWILRYNCLKVEEKFYERLKPKNPQQENKFLNIIFAMIYILNSRFIQNGY